MKQKSSRISSSRAKELRGHWTSPTARQDGTTAYVTTRWQSTRSTTRLRLQMKAIHLPRTPSGDSCVLWKTTLLYLHHHRCAAQIPCVMLNKEETGKRSRSAFCHSQCMGKMIRRPLFSLWEKRFFPMTQCTSFTRIILLLKRHFSKLAAWGVKRF